MISVICCYNKLEIVQTMLQACLEKQSEPHELILLDNRENTYPSAAKALNKGASQAKGDILIFAHQDIAFDDVDFLRKIRLALDSNERRLIGLAGTKDKSGVYTNLIQGPNHQAAGEYQITELTRVQTLDEVLIACRTDDFNHLHFDEVVCDNWHLYGVDLCLSAEKLGIHSYVLPMQAYHLSSGQLSIGYAITLFKVIRKHRSNHTFIYTTCGTAKTTPLRSLQYVFGLIWDHVLFRKK